MDEQTGRNEVGNSFFVNETDITVTMVKQEILSIRAL